MTLGFSLSVLVPAIASSYYLRSPYRLVENRPKVLISVAVVAVVVAMLHLLGRWRPLATLRLLSGFVLFLVATLAPLVLVLATVVWTGVWFFTAFTSDDASVLPYALFFLVLLLAVPVQVLPGLITPHRPYRALLSRCFVTIRTSSGAGAAERPDEILLSSLSPANRAVPYPELLICAAANVSGVGAAPAGANVLPLTISATSMSISAPPAEACMDLAKLERVTSPPLSILVRLFLRWVPPRPMLSLASAMAITGAAVSPSMGRMSNPRLRPLLAALNVRLGVWLPNPLSAAARRAVDGYEAETSIGADRIKLLPPQFSTGIVDLVQEMIGRNSANAPLIYASDGGHYENLGVLELLRKECTEIWAIDASGDRPGRATALVQAILLAEAELGCHIDMDIERFQIDPETSRPRFTHCHGTVTYASGERAALHVVKLGLTPLHSGILYEYECQDVGFPYHSTIRQVYKAERFEAYRRLGYESTLRMAEDWDCRRET